MERFQLGIVQRLTSNNAGADGGAIVAGGVVTISNSTVSQTISLDTTAAQSFPYRLNIPDNNHQPAACPRTIRAGINGGAIENRSDS